MKKAHFGPFLLIHFALKQKMEKGLIFWQKPRSNPFFKMQILGFFNRCFYSLNDFHSFWNFTKHFLLRYFALIQNMEKLLIFWQKPWTNPFGKMQIVDVFLIDLFTTHIKLLFVLKYYTTLFIALFCIKTIDGKRFNFWTISEQ